MDEKTTSALRIYSLGRVANNKELNTDVISVVPIESVPFMDGELVSMPFEQETQGTDAQGGSYNLKVTTDTAVQAKWLASSNSNRRTAPDVRRGERVLLWTYADTNEYWWTDMNLDSNLRKLETVVFQISATQDEATDSQLPENCYYIELSSHKKLITLQTSKANGEFATYACQFNLGEGRVVLTDELGNSFMLNSKETALELENAEGTYLYLDRKKIVGYAKDAIQLTADKSISMTTKDYKIQATTYTLKSQTNTIDSSSTTVKGTVSFENAARFKGTVVFEQPITANGITSSARIQGPNGSI